jgi:Leucine-rich repeat (LRR) protein
MAFHACDESTVDCNNPSNHQAYVAQSDDGASWSILSGWTALPPEIGNLTNLTVLYLSGNQLTALPPEIGNLTNLT